MLIQHYLFSKQNLISVWNDSNFLYFQVGMLQSHLIFCCHFVAAHHSANICIFGPSITIAQSKTVDDENYHLEISHPDSTLKHDQE